MRQKSSLPCQGTVAEEASAQQFPEKTREEKKIQKLFFDSHEIFQDDFRCLYINWRSSHAIRKAGCRYSSYL